MVPPADLPRLRDSVRQPPRAHGLARSRWRLGDLRAVRPALASYSASGLRGLRRRAHMRRVRGRMWVHSPDPDYQPKLVRVRRAEALTVRYPHRVLVYSGDELRLHRQPTLAQTYARSGEEARARLAPRANHVRRYQGALDMQTGRVVWRAGARSGLRALCACLAEVRQASGARHVFLVCDTWLVHRHARVLAAAQRWHVQLLWLPTYAPWTNPIEKLWRWVRQTRVHQQQDSAAFPDLQQALASFLDAFHDGSHDLPHYVGRQHDMSGVTNA